MEKFVRFEYQGSECFGRYDGDQIEIIKGAYWEKFEPINEFVGYEDVKLLCPVQPSKIICVGLNYHAHVEHSQSAATAPERPLIFLKPPSALIGPGTTIEYPDSVDRVDYEAELGVVIGKRGRKISQKDALEHVFGYTCVNDVTARKVQKADGQWTRGKGYDTFCPVGPYVVRGVDVSDVAVEAYLNGKQKQHGRTADFIFPIPYLIEFISECMTLEAGDIISTGTPQGIDPMQRGDMVEVRVENVGSLVNTVA